jgi:hypothetical protein
MPPPTPPPPASDGEEEVPKVDYPEDKEENNRLEAEAQAEIDDMEWAISDTVTQHTTACCSMQVVDITLAEQASTNITSLRMVQQKHCGPKYKLINILLQTKA